VFRHERIGNYAVFAEYARGADLVEPHEPRVASDVSRHDCGEPASYTTWLVLLQFTPPVSQQVSGLPRISAALALDRVPGIR
jgi:hypothetical protein